MTHLTPSSSLSWHRRPFEWLNACTEENALVAEEFARDNLRRLRLAAPTILLVNLAVSLLFVSIDMPADVQQARWWMAILLIQGVMAATFAALGLIAHWRLSRPPQLVWDQALGLAGAASLVLCTAALSIIDQWVKQGIMTLVIGLMAGAMIFLIRPFHAIVLFCGTGAIGIAGLALTQSSPTVLLSDQATVVAATVTAIFLASLLWRDKTVNALLRHALRLSHAALEKKKAELEILAATDPLTGMFNRRAFLDLAERELARAHRLESPYVVLMMDLDLFKRVNDDYGHQAGDRVLVAFAAVVKRCFRIEDLAGRYGGEEFCAILPGVTMEQATVIAERLRGAVSQCTLGDLPRTTTISIGIAACSGKAQVSLDAAIGRADEALYRAKHDGRDRVVGLDFGADATATL